MTVLDVESFRGLFPENNQTYIIPYSDFHDIWENEFKKKSKYEFIRYLYICNSLPFTGNENMRFAALYFNKEELTSDLNILLKTDKVTHYCKYPLPVDKHMKKLTEHINEELKDNFGEIRINRMFNHNDTVMVECIIED